MLGRRSLLRLAITLGAVSSVLGSGLSAADLPVIEVFKLPTCTCCKNWIKHLERNGFQVTATDVPDVEARTRVEEKYGVPKHLSACHTAIVDGYVLGGHVAADEIRQLLATRPRIRGLFVAGMPKGAPGMEGGEAERYEVIATDADGRETVFAVHEP